MSTQTYTLPRRPLSISASSSLKLSNGGNVFDMPITSVVVIGTTTPDGNFFHFRLSLVGENGSSIRLDITPSYTDMNCLMRGILRVEYKSYAFSTSHGTDPFQVPVKPGTTAATLCYYLLDYYKLDQYIFTDEGQGCRHWCATALSTLAAAGFVDPNVDRIFATYEIAQAQKYGAKFPMPRIKGTRY